MRLSIVVEFQSDTTIVDLQSSNISIQTIDQSTGTSMVTDNTTTDKSQQMSSRISSRYFIYTYPCPKTSSVLRTPKKRP